MQADLAHDHYTGIFLVAQMMQGITFVRVYTIHFFTFFIWDGGEPSHSAFKLKVRMTLQEWHICLPHK